MAQNMVIVGAGECGTRAAFALREAGHVGPITLFGDEPQLPYERPPLSKAGMAGDTLAPKLIADAARLAEAGIDHRRGVRIAVIDRAARLVLTESGEAVPYDRLLLATGSTPRLLLQQQGAPLPHVAYLRTFADAEALKARLTPGARVLLVGAGFIGLELAAAAALRGCMVTVVEMLPRILARVVPAEIAEIIAARHRAAGVTLLTGVGIEAIETGAAAVRLTLANGSRFDADVLIAGIGALPATGLAQASGLALDNGIAVSAELATTDPAIYAAGDCCSLPLALYDGRRVRIEAWRSAQEHGNLAARNLLGAAEKHAFVPWFWSDQYELGLQIAGLPDEGDETVRRDLGEGTFLLFHLKAGRLVAASGIGPGTSIARDIRLAEMLIARRATPTPAALAAPEVKLKALLAA